MRDYWVGRPSTFLAGPFRRQVGEARNRHALRKSPFNGGSDEVRCRNASEIVILTLRTLHHGFNVAADDVSVPSVRPSGRQ